MITKKIIFASAFGGNQFAMSDADRVLSAKG